MNLQEIRNNYNSSTEFFQAILDGCNKLAQEQPDFVYNPRKTNAGCLYNGPCVYRDENGSVIGYGPDCAGCIIGQSLQRMGWADANELTYGGLVRFLLSKFSPDEESYNLLEKLATIQMAQDQGMSWEGAVFSND